MLIVAYGTVARVCQTAIDELREEGVRGGAVPADLAVPVPVRPLCAAPPSKAKAVLVVEMSTGQMVEDVHLAVQGRQPVHFFGRRAACWSAPEEVVDAIREVSGGSLGWRCVHG